MEYVEGETLFARLGRGPLPRETALRIAMQIAEGLAEAHRCGIIHRDLKPANVMLTGSRDAPNAKLLDFGVAKIAAPPSSAAQRTAAPTVSLTTEGAGHFSQPSAPAHIPPWHAHAHQLAATLRAIYSAAGSMALWGQLRSRYDRG